VEGKGIKEKHFLLFCQYNLAYGRRKGILTQRELGMFMIPVHTKDQLEIELREIKDKYEQINPNKEIILDVRPNPAGVEFNGTDNFNFYVTVPLRLKGKEKTNI
jgi:hypothetical protein